MHELRRKCTRKSDQKPLESILKKSLAFAPKRLQVMMMKLRKYDNEVQYKRDRKLYLADRLSRAYLSNTVHPTAAEFEKINAAAFLPVSTSRLREIHKATQNDEIL